MAGTQISVREGAIAQVSGGGLPITVDGPYITEACQVRWEHIDATPISRRFPEPGGEGLKIVADWPEDVQAPALRLIIESPVPDRLPVITVENPEAEPREVSLATWEASAPHGLFNVKTLELESGEAVDSATVLGHRYGVPWSKLAPRERYRVVIRESDGRRFHRVLADFDLSPENGRFPAVARDIDGPVDDWERELLRRGTLRPGHLSRLLALQDDADFLRLAERLGRTLFDVVPRLWAGELTPQPEAMAGVRDLQASTVRRSRHVAEALHYVASYHVIAQRFRAAELWRTPYLTGAFTPERCHDALAALALPSAEAELATPHLFDALFSSLWDRDRASRELAEAWRANPEFMAALRIDEGASTYLSEAEVQAGIGGGYEEVAESLRFVSEPPRTGPDGAVIVCSCDPVFGRVYLPIWLAIADYLRPLDIALHFTVCGEEAACAELLENAEALLDRLGRLRVVDRAVHAANVTFSWLPVPSWVQLPRAFYACARLLVLGELARACGSLLIVNDIDLAMREDPAPFVRSLPRDRICLGAGRGVYVLSPWRRIVATTMTVPAGLHDDPMLTDLRRYIEAGLRRHRAWMIDQNAIAYMVERAWERGDGERLQDLAGYGRPTRRDPVMTLYEILQRRGTSSA